MTTGGERRECDGSRLIRLRRPASILRTDGPFVPGGGHALDAVDRRWEAVRARNPAAFDGRLLHVTGVHRNGCGGATIHAMDCAYRFHAVQNASFDVGCRPLGVKGITIRDGRILLGRRARWVLSYGGKWEFAPAGAVEPDRDPADVVVSELAEETGLTVEAAPTAVALLFDGVLRCWEMVFRVMPSAGATDAGSGEYDDLVWCAPDALPAPLTPVAAQMRVLVTGDDP